MDDAYRPAKKYQHSKLLYQILPSVYRERDSNQDLRKFLNGSGVLLDQMHNTLLQRYADIFPDADKAFDINSQSWLLPYIAALLDVRMVAPTVDGQREEIANAIAWRKGKGTLSVVEEIAEKIGGMEVVVHEGWKRVATTARVGMPVLPLESYGYQSNANNEQYEDDFNNFNKHSDSELPDRKPDLAPMWARHPGLPAGTVDLRCQASAVPASVDNPAAQISQVNGQPYRWRQSSLHGAPNCNEEHTVLPVDARTTDWIPGYFDDPSVRTVDFRTPNWRQGYFHPQRLLLFAATPTGFFSESSVRSVSWIKLKEIIKNLFQKPDLPIDEPVTVEKKGDRLIIRNKILDEGSLEAIRVQQQRPDFDDLPGNNWRFEGFIFINTIDITSGYAEFDRCAVRAVETETEDTGQAVIQADNSLFKSIQAEKGLVKLQYCTVLATTITEKLQASDCIFNGSIQRDITSNSSPGEGCVRYSAILPKQQQGSLQFSQHHFLRAIFYNGIFSHPGCAVLHRATSTLIRNGAEDGGEMGVFHDLHLSARRQAVITKLADFLPTGIKPVIIPDTSINDLLDEAVHVVSKPDIATTPMDESVTINPLENDRHVSRIISLEPISPHIPDE